MMIVRTFILFVALGHSAETFQPQGKRRGRPTHTGPGSSKSHQALNAVSAKSLIKQKWADLEARQRDYMLGSHEQAEAYRLAREMVELALTTVQSAQEDEYEHAMEARKKLEMAVDQEHELEEAALNAHEEAQEAFNQIKSFDHRYLSNLDEWEKHRQLTNFEVAHRVEEYVQKQLGEARAAEEAAKQEEEGADFHFLELTDKADELQEFLNRLKQSAVETENI